MIVVMGVTSEATMGQPSGYVANPVAVLTAVGSALISNDDTFINWEVHPLLSSSDDMGICLSAAFCIPSQMDSLQ